MREAAELVGYEFEQLVLSVVAHSQKLLFGNPVNNATLESFLIHYRNLRSFLYPTETDYNKSDNVLAVDFIPEWPFTAKDWREVAELESQRLNRALAHISYSRIKYKEQDKKDWPASQMAKKMMEEMGQFVDKLPGSSRQHFQRVLATLQLVRVE